MKLTDYMSGKKFDIDADLISEIKNVGHYRQVITKPQKLFEKPLLFTVREMTDEITSLMRQEQEFKRYEYI